MTTPTHEGNEFLLSLYERRLMTPDDAKAKAAELIATRPAEDIAKEFAASVAAMETTLLVAYKIADVEGRSKRTVINCARRAVELWAEGRKREARECLTQLIAIADRHDNGAVDVTPAEPLLRTMFDSVLVPA